MTRIAVIGGTGLNRLPDFEVRSEQSVGTPFGEPDALLVFGGLNGAEVVFLARHGPGHRLAPHRINYRANIAALKQAGVETALAVNAVGGITERMVPGALVIPDQIIDYSWGREHSFVDGSNGGDLLHVEFTEPYTPALRAQILDTAATEGLEVVDGGVHGITQGPRLESAAEIVRMRRDGCDLVGMTGMPEAGLAREAGLHYACCALVVNWAAGTTDSNGDIHGQIEAALEQSLGKLLPLFEILLPRLAESE